MHFSAFWGSCSVIIGFWRQVGLRTSKPHSRRGFVAGNGTKLIESVDSKMSKIQMSKYTFSADSKSKDRLLEDNSIETTIL